MLGANEALFDSDGFLHRFFDEVVEDGEDGQPDPNKLTLRAQSVVLEYPQMAEDGAPSTVNVQVPRVTLVPHSLAQIEEVKFQADFEVLVNNGELQLAFGKERGRNGTFGSIEVRLAPAELPDAMKEILDGYERALKAQIPH